MRYCRAPKQLKAYVWGNLMQRTCLQVTRSWCGGPPARPRARPPARAPARTRACIVHPSMLQLRSASTTLLVH